MGAVVTWALGAWTVCLLLPAIFAGLAPSLLLFASLPLVALAGGLGCTATPGGAVAGRVLLLGAFPTCIVVVSDLLLPTANAPGHVVPAAATLWLYWWFAAGTHSRPDAESGVLHVPLAPWPLLSDPPRKVQLRTFLYASTAILAVLLIAVAPFVALARRGPSPTGGAAPSLSVLIAWGAIVTTTATAALVAPALRKSDRRSRRERQRILTGHTVSLALGLSFYAFYLLTR